MLCVHLEGWDREGGRETQEGGDMGIYVKKKKTFKKEKETKHKRLCIV